MKHITALIVVTKTELSILDACVNSIDKSAKRANMYIDYIIIANGCKVRKLPLNEGKIKYIHLSKNIGFGQAINKGMNYVKREWCIIACPDTITSDRCIINLINYTDEDNVVLLAPQILLDTKKYQETILPIPSLKEIFVEQSFFYRLIPSLFNSPFSNRKFYKVYNYVDGIAAIWWMIKKDVFLKLGGFDKRFFLYFEDIDLCKRIKDAKFLIAYVPDAKATHNPHQSTGGTASGRLYFLSLKSYLNKYYGEFYSSVCIFLFLLGSMIRILYWEIRMYVTPNPNIKEFSRQKIQFCGEILSSVLKQ